MPGDIVFFWQSGMNERKLYGWGTLEGTTQQPVEAVAKVANAPNFSNINEKTDIQRFATVTCHAVFDNPITLDLLRSQPDLRDIAIFSNKGWQGTS